jgi:hypothetical protein
MPTEEIRLVVCKPFTLRNLLGKVLVVDVSVGCVGTVEASTSRHSAASDCRAPINVRGFVVSDFHFR